MCLSPPQYSISDSSMVVFLLLFHFITVFVCFVPFMFACVLVHEVMICAMNLKVDLSKNLFWK